jgi:hypothetical protein
MYKVLEAFFDLQDGNHAYEPGDTFPRDGYKVSDDRLAELAGTDNRRGMKLIEKVEAKKRTTKKTV